MECLEDHGDAFPAVTVQIQPSKAFPLEKHPAFRRGVQPGKQGEQRGLPGTGRAYDGVDLPFLKCIGNTGNRSSLRIFISVRNIF